MSGCAGNNDEGAKVQEDVVTEQVENTEVEAEEESVPVEQETTDEEAAEVAEEETTENTYAFINLGTGDCMMIWDYYYDKNAEETGVDFKELLSWVILNLEVVE